MKEARFLVASSKGELEVWLYDDGFTSVDFTDRSPLTPGAEDLVRNESDLADCFRAVGIPQAEADQLAQELWSDLDQQEREARQHLRGRDESRKDYKKRMPREDADDEPS